MLTEADVNGIAIARRPRCRGKHVGPTFLPILGDFLGVRVSECLRDLEVDPALGFCVRRSVALTDEDQIGPPNRISLRASGSSL